MDAAQKARNRTWLEGLVTAEKWRTVGQLAPSLMEKLEARGLTPVSREIGISDKRVRHFLSQAGTTGKRGHKAPDNKGVPLEDVINIQDHLARPKAVLLEKGANALLFVFEPAGGKPGHLGVLPIKLRDKDKKVRTRHNWVQTGRQEQAEGLRDEKRYEILEGKI